MLAFANAAPIIRTSASVRYGSGSVHLRYNYPRSVNRVCVLQLTEVAGLVPTLSISTPDRSQSMIPSDLTGSGHLTWPCPIPMSTHPTPMGPDGTPPPWIVTTVYDPVTHP